MFIPFCFISIFFVLFYFYYFIFVSYPSAFSTLLCPISLLLISQSHSKISENTSRASEKYTIGQRAADAIAKFASSWAFIFAFTGVLILWIVINTLLAVKAFDPFPFILLNLVLSCVAAIQAPLIMMSQNRQEEKDRQRAENDYKVNLKTEIMIEDLYTLTVVCFLVVRKMICPSTMTL